MQTTCILCCEDSHYFLLPPCNHKEMCWKCALKLIQGNRFSCPFCKEISSQCHHLLFVHDTEMNEFNYDQMMKRGTIISKEKKHQCYSTSQVSRFIQNSTQICCKLCPSIFGDTIALQKHLQEVHCRYFCRLCLLNKKCLLSEQVIYSNQELKRHFQEGERSQQGQLLLYHPYCQICELNFYDFDSFKVHFRTSAHLKCHICTHNFPHFQYIYYRNYLQMEEHFRTSHYLCQTGACATRKLENVFKDKAALTQHKKQVHKNKVPIEGEDKSDYQKFDGIGFNFEGQFTIFQHREINNADHEDQAIDLRQFYEKKGNQLSLKQIISQIKTHEQQKQKYNDKVMINEVVFFSPLQLEILKREEIQRLLKFIYDPRTAERITTQLFQNSSSESLVEIKKIMQERNNFSYYYVYPQLIRWFNKENPRKMQMDHIYAQSLKELKVIKNLVFHMKEKYSDLLLLLQEQIHNYLFNLIIDDDFPLPFYLKYLQTMSVQFYENNYNKIFYVPKEKMINLYHMIEKSETKSLLKFSWLTKLGMPIETQRFISQSFLYSTIENCGIFIETLSFHNLSLLYAYVSISLEAVSDSQNFKKHKKTPLPLFLSTVLNKMSKCLSNQDISEIENMERKSLKLHQQVIQESQSKKKSVVNQEDHPSLLDKIKQSHKIGKIISEIESRKNNERKREEKVVEENKGNKLMQNDNYENRSNKLEDQKYEVKPSISKAPIRSNKIYKEDKVISEIQKQIQNQVEESELNFWKKKKKVKRSKVRLDLTSSDEEEERKRIEREEQRNKKMKKFQEEERLRESLRYSEGFDSLFERNSQSKVEEESIVNKIAATRQKEEEVEPERKIRKNKKGKKVIIERVDLSKL